jgi:hypothetical protein
MRLFILTAFYRCPVSCGSLLVGRATNCVVELTLVAVLADVWRRRMGRLPLLPWARQDDCVLPARCVPDCQRGDEGAGSAVLGNDCGWEVQVRRPLDL